MRIHLLLLPLFSLLLFPSFVFCENAEQIVETMQAKQREREKGLGSYIIQQVTQGTSSLLYFEKDYKIGEFRMVPESDLLADAALKKGWGPSQSKAFMGGMALGMEAARQGIKDELGLPAGNAILESMKLGVLDLMKIQSALPTTQGYLKDKQNRSDEVAQRALDMSQFGKMAQVTGAETVHGKDAHVLRADDLNMTQKDKAGDFTVSSVTMWVDRSDYVPLRVRVDGAAKASGERRAVSIEKDSFDYKEEGPLYLPHREIMRIANIMSKSDQAKMKEAQDQLAEMKSKLQGPQKAMIEAMMGPQLKMLENMAKGGGIEIETVTKKVIIGASRADYMAALSQSPVG